MNVPSITPTRVVSTEATVGAVPGGQSKAIQNLETRPESPLGALHTWSDTVRGGTKTAQPLPAVREEFSLIKQRGINKAPSLTAEKSTASVDQLQLAAYAMGRAANGRPVEASDAERLIKANETLRQTREAFSTYGRANVRPDVFRSRQHGIWRTRASRSLYENYYWDMPDTLHATALGPAIASLAQTGNCTEYATFATHIHGAKLGENESVHFVTCERIDHGWSETTTHERRSKTIVMDAWADGPAIFAEDGRFSGAVTDAEKDFTLDRTQGALAAKKLHDLRKILLPQLKQPLDDLSKKINDRYRRLPVLPFELWEPQPVLSTAFAKSALKKLYEPVAPCKLGAPAQVSVRPNCDPKIALRNEIRAVGVARTLLGKNVSAAVGAAPAIVTAAKDLLEAHAVDTPLRDGISL